ncbi:uncharacterized protein EI97DRAFT_484943 [Westerdykella ornata]|uniref:Uncharacterized protein n=1 Tax=Westerdykella ornata TaxID=318751 RepID=A0A6A6JR42_WESOR|nr:uncharacterized protein EI97DRAFT_484943 [Westerdykella ornata]KAF2279101.1 hypothetical protein EI97DRAFT_484943 [Westerdykella ornata]
MSHQRPSSAASMHTIFDAELKTVDARPISTIPADHSDPNHPHNGDVERQIGSPRKSLPSKKILWILGLVLLALGTLGAAVGLGVWSGKNHGESSDDAGRVENATATVFTTVDPVDIATTTLIKTIDGTSATTIVTLAPMPNNQVCKKGGRWPSEELCREACVGIQGYELVHCGKFDDKGHFWQCHQCAAVKPTVSFKPPVPVEATPIPDPKSVASPPGSSGPKEEKEGQCLISGHFSSKDECSDHCKIGAAGDEKVASSRPRKREDPDHCNITTDRRTELEINSSRPKTRPPDNSNQPASEPMSANKLTNIPLHAAENPISPSGINMPAERYPTDLPPRRRKPSRLSNILHNRKLGIAVGLLLFSLLVVGTAALGFFVGGRRNNEGKTTVHANASYPIATVRPTETVKVIVGWETATQLVTHAQGLSTTMVTIFVTPPNKMDGVAEMTRNMGSDSRTE